MGFTFMGSGNREYVFYSVKRCLSLTTWSRGLATYSSVRCSRVVHGGSVGDSKGCGHSADNLWSRTYDDYTIDLRSS